MRINTAPLGTSTVSLDEPGHNDTCVLCGRGIVGNAERGRPELRPELRPECAYSAWRGREVRGARRRVATCLEVAPALGNYLDLRDADSTHHY